MLGKVIVVISDALLVREAIADHLRRCQRVQVVATAAETFADILGAFGPDSAVVAVVDLHSFGPTTITVSAAKVIRSVRADCPGTTIVALGSGIELAAQAMDADILLDATRASLHDLAHILSVAEHQPPEPQMIPGTVQLDRAMWNAVSRREKDVLTFLAQGHDNLKIAAELGISERTVKAHVASLMKKLAADNRTEVALLGRDAGFRRPGR